MKKHTGFLLIYLVFMPLALAESVNDLGSNPLKEKMILNNDSLINGLIVDQTMTLLGKNFYFYFSQLMNESHEKLNVNLRITERPTALSGSIITIFHINTAIYRTSLSPGRQQAKLKAEEALRNINYYLVKWKIEKRFEDNNDLASDEL
ncbi:CsgE family curli-type amyloid fiber assembly protein [Vibrio algicola]|uniref:Curli production assembly/transport component CsgE n=1 Tax=Vibrio algicola TaxID=2662262 RepID=A0A5Q0THI9_9VIBR|nr:CsgE family curli-type amyloid fiber assembly protein [Vibrio algicola]